MTVDGREDLFHYTYLNANGYLEKFRGALNLPGLTVPLLAALLKTYKDKTRTLGFIVKSKSNKPSLYNKEILNKILGMSNDGHFYMKPEQNPNLQMLHRIIDEWDMKAYDRENPKQASQEDMPSYASDEEDMQKVSDELIRQGNLNEMKKGKKIFITESQFSNLKKRLAENYFVETNKVKIVEKYLDDNFVRGELPAIGEDGYPRTIGVVGLKFKDGNIAKNMTATQLFYMLQDKFNKIYEDPKQRDAFLKKIVVDWYYKRIKNGLLSKNNY